MSIFIAHISGILYPVDVISVPGQLDLIYF
jgi:hypothetical protein